MNDHYMKVSWSYAAAQILILDQLGFPKQRAYEILGFDEDPHLHPAQHLDAVQLNKVFDHAEKALNDCGRDMNFAFQILAKPGMYIAFVKI